MDKVSEKQNSFPYARGDKKRAGMIKLNAGDIQAAINHAEIHKTDINS